MYGLKKIAAIDFKTICILCSRQEAKTHWRSRGSRRSWRYSTPWDTASFSTWMARRGSYGKRIHKECLITVDGALSPIQDSNYFCRLSYNQIGGIFTDNPAGLPLVWVWNANRRESILETVYTVCVRTMFIGVFPTSFGIDFRSIMNKRMELFIYFNFSIGLRIENM